MATVKKQAKQKEEGAIKPWDMVEFAWKKATFAKNETSMIHRTLAEKLAKQGKGQIVKDGKTDLRESKNDEANV